MSAILSSMQLRSTCTRSQTQTTPAKITRYCKRSSLGLFGSGNETTCRYQAGFLTKLRRSRVHPHDLQQISQTPNVVAT